MAILAITFQACRKEAFTEQLSSSSALKNPITSDAAKAWFQNQFGETKLISPNSVSSSSDTLDGYYFDASYEITPLWSESKITTYLQTNPILLVPVKPIPFLDAKGQHYTLVFFRDSLSQLDARLQVYEATPGYAKNNPKFSVNNFTGFFYQIHLTGKVDKAYGIEQGKFTIRIPIKPKEKSRIGKIQTRGLCDDCFYDDPTTGFVKKAICWLCDRFTISNSGDTGIDPITSSDPYGYLGYGETPTIDIGYGENTSVGSTGSSNPLGTGSNSLGTEFDDSIFNDPAYQQKIKEDYVLLTLNPTGVERQFLADNRALFDQFYSFLTQQGDYLGKKIAAQQHLTLLVENTAYLSAYQQANSPEIGSESWEKNVVNPLLGPELVVQYSVWCVILKHENSKRPVNERWSDARIRLQAFWNTTKELIHTGLDIAGLVPGFGEIFDGANGIFYTIEGDGLNATLSFAATMPIAGWVATGSKYAIKTIGKSGRAYHLNYKVVNGIIEFGDKDALRSQLRRILNLSVGDGLIAHHIIPLAQTDNLLLQAAAKFKAAFHPNEFNNGIALSSAVHTGSHQAYSDLVVRRMNEIYIASGGINITPQKAHEEIQNLMNRIRIAIQNNPNKDLDNLFF